ncbi:MAG: ArsC/Spx/MgsR family protein [Gemmatimonadaceae bacterium]
MPPADLQVQIFGTKKNSDTRKALRFFAERRVKTHFVDLMERAAALGELRRFSQKFGVEKLIDRESKRFAELGLRTALYGEERWLSILIDEPLILQQPLVRCANKVAIGVNETEWKAWLA